MNLEAINKWLDEEYGCSFTRLEELHDFYFEKYCDLKKENQELKKQLEELDKKLFFTNNELEMRQKSIDNKLNQQNEFIEYMNKTIEELECEDFDDEEMKGYLIQRIDTFKEILSKFKKIIGDVK